MDERILFVAEQVGRVVSDGAAVKGGAEGEACQFVRCGGSSGRAFQRGKADGQWRGFARCVCLYEIGHSGAHLLHGVEFKLVFVLALFQLCHCHAVRHSGGEGKAERLPVSVAADASFERHLCFIHGEDAFGEEGLFVRQFRGAEQVARTVRFLRHHEVPVFGHGVGCTFCHEERKVSRGR